MGDERPGRSGLTLRGTAGPRTLGEVLHHRSLRLVGLSWGSSTTAEGAYLVVLGVFAYEEGGAVAVGLVGLIRMVPASAAASFGSLLADRFAHERILRAVEAMRAALLAGAAFAAFAGAPAALVFMVAAVHALVSVSSDPPSSRYCRRSREPQRSSWRRMRPPRRSRASGRSSARRSAAS